MCLSDSGFVAGSGIGHRTLNLQKSRENLHASARANKIAEERFHLKSNEEYPGAAPQSGFVRRANGKMATFMSAPWRTVR